MKHHHYYFNIRHYLATELSKIELSVWLHAIAHSLVGVFIPILLLQSGFSLLHVILFLLLFNIFDVPLNFLARRLVLRFGAVNTIMLSNVAALAYFGLIGFTQYSWPVLVVMAFAAAVYDSFYWVAHWFVFNQAVRATKEVGKQVSLVMFARSLGGFIAPAVGALILIFLDKGYLILVSMLLFGLAALTICSIKQSHLKPKKEKSLSAFFKEKWNRNNFVTTILYAFHTETEGTILPLVIFLMFKSIEMVGALPVITAFFAMIFMLYVGKLTDRLSRRFMIAFGAVGISIVWLIRLLLPGLDTFYLTAIAIAFLAPLVFIPLEARLVQAAKKTGVLNASTFHNTAYMGTNVVIYAILFLTVEIVKVPFLEAALAMILLALFNSLLLLGQKKAKPVSAA